MQTTPRLTAGFTASILSVLLLTLAGSAQAPAGTVALPPGAIAPSERQRLVARRVGMILEDTHYRRANIDDELSEQVYQRYLKFLDGQHSYFLASDIAEFDAAFTKQCQSGSQAAQLLAAATRHLQNLHLMRGEIESGNRNAAAVVAAARPPVFFARRRAVERALASWNSDILGSFLDGY